MKLLKSVAVLCLTAVLFSCNDQQSLQEYYVDSAEKPDFISVDIPASLLELDEVGLTAEQKEAYESLKKFNVLAYRLKEDNKSEYEIEKEKVAQILKQTEYQELMKFNDKGRRGIIKYLGTEDAIDEVIIYGNDTENGFALVRVLGEDMKPASMMKLMDALKNADFDGEEFKKIGEFFRK